MNRALILFAVLLSVAATPQSGGDCVDCPDRTRPWMRGHIEKACSYDGHPIEGDTATEWHVCRCQHVCDPTDERADETGGRRWDPMCEARCKPSHCHCKHGCGEGDS